MSYLIHLVCYDAAGEKVVNAEIDSVSKISAEDRARRKVHKANLPLKKVKKEQLSETEANWTYDPNAVEETPAEAPVAEAEAAG